MQAASAESDKRIPTPLSSLVASGIDLLGRLGWFHIFFLEFG